MADQDSLRKNLSLLFIKPEDYDAFHALVQPHIFQHPSDGALELRGKFLQQYGQQVWPRDMRMRKHLNQSPSLDEVKYWAGGKHRRSAAEGPLFEHHGHTKKWKKNKGLDEHQDNETAIQDDLSRSRLGVVLGRYIDAVKKSQKSKAPAHQPGEQPEDLIKRILRPAPSLSAKPKPNLLASTAQQVTGTNNGLSLVKEGSLSSSNSKTGGCKPTIAQQGDHITGHIDHVNHINRTIPVKLGQNLERSQQRLTDGVYSASLSTQLCLPEEENAVEAIKKIRGFMYEDASIAAEEVRGQKRNMAADVEGNLPKKRRLRDKNRSPPRGTFDIPPNLQRVEAIPLRNKPDQLQVSARTVDSEVPANSLVPLAHDESVQGDLHITEIAFNYMEAVTSMPPPQMNEEARSKTLALYMKETGGMGGLPVVQ